MNIAALRFYRIIFFISLSLTVLLGCFGLLLAASDYINRLRGVPETGWGALAFMFGFFPIIAVLTLVDFTLWNKIKYPKK